MMDADTRENIIHTVLKYARAGGDPCLPEFVGWAPCSDNCTDEQEQAVLAAVLPLLPDERLNLIMHHIAEVLVSAKSAMVEVAA
jgi:hypothetical protein